MATNNKMQWFINEYNNDSLTFDIASTKRNYGTICMPTGTGKSGKIYANIIYNINELEKDGWKKKLVVNLNSPYLKLNNQLIRDLEEILVGTNILKKEEIGIYVNSSDNAKTYGDYIDNNPEPFKSISKFGYKLNIIASCNPSLYHFYKKMNKMDRTNLEVITYLDEAHTLNGEFDEPENKGMNKESNTPDLNKLCKVCDKVYAFSATPDPYVTKRINIHEHGIKDEELNKFIVTLTPADAIAENMIIAPRFRYTSFNGGSDTITSELCIGCLNDAKTLTPEINHKVLVNCSDSKHLYNLRKSLEEKGYKVFSTCAKYLYDLDPNNNYEEAKIMSITDFTKQIEDYDGDCFVLHIRQLICGIDVKGLTDCIIYDNFTGAKSSWRVYVQTIGRILRAANGERGKKVGDRTKKYGNVYFYNSEKDEIQKKNIAQMFTSVYGISTVFENVFSESNKHGLTKHSMSINKNKDDEDDNKGELNYDEKNPYIEDIRISLKNIVDTYKRVGAYDMLKKTKLFKDQIDKDFMNSCGYISSSYTTIDIINTQESLKQTIDYVGKSMALW